MARKLSPIEVYRLLPKTNCGDCGLPTCMAFAFKLVQGAIEADKCPHLSLEAERAIGAMTAPPVALVVFGRGDEAVRVGGERVCFRHEDRFYNEPVIAVELSDLMEPDVVEEVLASVEKARVERMGGVLKVNALAIVNRSNRVKPLVDLVEAVKPSGYPLIVSTSNPSTAMAALRALSGEKPLLHGATLRSLTAMASIARRFRCPISVKASDWRTLLAAVARLRGLGVSEIVLQPPGETLREVLEGLTLIRRLAVDRGFDRLGYPTITFPGELKSRVQEPLKTVALMMRFSSIVVVKPKVLTGIKPVMLLRQSIMMNPRAPASVKPGLYTVGNPTAESPVILTTNYALTYHIVYGDLRSAGVHCYLLVIDTGGLSVSTAVAGDRFKPESIRSLIEETGLLDRVSHRTLVIPGRASRLSGEIEDATGWKVLVGPLDSRDIAGFLMDKGLLSHGR